PAALTMYRTIVLILAPCYRPAEFPFPGKGGEKRRFPQVRRRVHTLRPSPQIQSGQRSHTDLTWRRCAATWILAGLYAMLRQRATTVVVLGCGDSDYLYRPALLDRKSTRLNSSHVSISYAVF